MGGCTIHIPEVRHIQTPEDGENSSTLDFSRDLESLRRLSRPPKYPESIPVQKYNVGPDIQFTPAQG